jgi:hypothetical protein
MVKGSFLLKKDFFMKSATIASTEEGTGMKIAIIYIPKLILLWHYS